MICTLKASNFWSAYRKHSLSFFLRPFELLAAALEGVELIVAALCLEQRLVRALLEDLAVGEENDLIGAADRRQTVRDHEHGSDIHHPLERILDQNLGLGIDVGGRLVEDHDLRLMHDGAGKGEQLPLPCREVVAPLAHLLVESPRETVDEGIGVDVFAGRAHFVVGDRLVA